MSDAGPPVSDAQEPAAAAPPQPATPKKKPGMMADPVVRTLTTVAIVLLVGFLIVVLGVVLSGVTAPSGPRSLVENELAVSGEAVRSGKADADTWGNYIAALIANGRYGQARSVLDDAKSSIDDSATAVFAVAEVRLLNAQKDYAKTIVVADKAQKDADAACEARRSRAAARRRSRPSSTGFLPTTSSLRCSRPRPTRGSATGRASSRSWTSTCRRTLRRRTSSSIARNAKVELKDTEGAEKDYREALKFVPDDEEALAGLEKIGAATNE